MHKSYRICAIRAHILAPIKYIPIVRDYPDVFPEDLPAFPPKREVEFTIDLAPRTTPILTIPSRLRGFVVYSDASRQRLGCVLMQHGKVVAYASR